MYGVTVESFRDDVDELANDWDTSRTFKPKDGVAILVLPASPAVRYYLLEVSNRCGWKVSISDGVAAVLSSSADPLVSDWFNNHLDRSERLYYGILAIADKIDNEPLVADIIRLSTSSRELSKYLIDGLKQIAKK